MKFPFLFLKCSRSVIVVLHIFNMVFEMSLLSDLTLLWWIGDEVPWSNNNITWVLFRLVILLDMVNLLHMCISGICWLFHVFGWFELNFMTGSCNPSSISSSCNHSFCSFLEWLTDSIIDWLLAKQGAVNGWTLFDWVSYDVWWVNYDIFFLRMSSCCDKHEKEYMNRYGNQSMINERRMKCI